MEPKVPVSSEDGKRGNPCPGLWVLSLLGSFRPASTLPAGLHPTTECASQWVHLLSRQELLSHREPIGSSLLLSAAAPGHSQRGRQGRRDPGARGGWSESFSWEKAVRITRKLKFSLLLRWVIFPTIRTQSVKICLNTSRHKELTTSQKGDQFRFE